MVLEAKNDRIFRRDERRVPHRVNHVLEENVRAHSFAMRNYRLLVLPFSIPTIQLDAPSSSTRSSHAFTTCDRSRIPILPATGQQHLSVHLDAALPAELTAAQIRVVARVDVIMRQRLIHVHVNVQPVQEYGGIFV